MRRTRLWLGLLIGALGVSLAGAGTFLAGQSKVPQEAIAASVIRSPELAFAIRLQAIGS